MRARYELEWGERYAPPSEKGDDRSLSSDRRGQRRPKTEAEGLKRGPKRSFAEGKGLKSEAFGEAKRSKASKAKLLAKKSRSEASKAKLLAEQSGPKRSFAAKPKAERHQKRSFWPKAEAEAKLRCRFRRNVADFEEMQQNWSKKPVFRRNMAENGRFWAFLGRFWMIFKLFKLEN